MFINKNQEMINYFAILKEIFALDDLIIISKFSFLF